MIVLKLKLQPCIDVFHSDESVSENEQPEPTVRHSVREKRPPNMYGEWVSVAHGKTAEPTSVTDAMMSDEKEYWLDLMKQEMNSICENNVYDLVELPEGKRALNSRWVFKRKIASDGSIERYKARL